jgi:hypothetical protein
VVLVYFNFIFVVALRIERATMTINRVTAVRTAIAIILLAGVGVPVFAHHSQTQFDLTKTTTIKGVVTEVDWSNPHTFFYIEGTVVGDSSGTKKMWGLEGQSPNFLMGNGEGWKPDTLKVGDMVTATGNARKDGKPTMLLLGLDTANGKHYTSKSPFPTE